MFGDTAFSPEAVLAPAEIAIAPASVTSSFANTVASGPNAFDTWGAVTVPAVAAPATTPAGDPCLRVILDFLKAFLCADKNAAAAWAPVFPSDPPVKTTWQHDPSEVHFVTSQLPALYMWRESATQDYIADDWLRETTQVKALWVFPLVGIQEQQRLRMSFSNVMAKAIAVGIERGRTPGYIVPGDMDPNAPSQGSLFYEHAGFERFRLVSWKRAKLQITPNEGSVVLYSAIEFTFEMFENLEYGLGRYDELEGADLALRNEAGQIIDAGPLQ